MKVAAGQSYNVVSIVEAVALEHMSRLQLGLARQNNIRGL